MPQSWLSIHVTLLGGRGTALWPRPGRVFAIGPDHTFEELADAINIGFARWDRSHLALFMLDDGTLIADAHTGQEFVGNPDGPPVAPLVMEETVVVDTVSPGTDFQYTFDLSDKWVHHCRVDRHVLSPLQQFGFFPDDPLPYSGWGTIPDQFGRQFPEDDAAHHHRPEKPHPMLTGAWPDRMLTSTTE